MSKKNVEHALKSKIKYSEQGIQYLRKLEDFDVEKFEKWFLENITIGGNTIMQYLINKK